MLHKNRCWRITDVESVETLADYLTERTWTICTGFRYAGLMFLNDATGPDGAQEYAIVREADCVQVESWTCSWMTADRSVALVREMIACDARTQFEQQVVVYPHPEGPCYQCR